MGKLVAGALEGNLALKESLIEMLGFPGTSEEKLTFEEFFIEYSKKITKPVHARASEEKFTLAASIIDVLPIVFPLMVATLISRVLNKTDNWKKVSKAVHLDGVRLCQMVICFLVAVVWGILIYGDGVRSWQMVKYFLVADVWAILIYGGLEEGIKIFKQREEEHNQDKQKLLRRLREREAEIERLQRNNEQCQMEMQKFEQRNKKLEKEMKQERTKQEQSERKMRELEQIKIKLEEKIWEQETKLKYATELDRYEMGEAPRGICLVINNFNFLGEEERQGAKLDEEAIARLFNELHFIVEIRQNLGGLEILKVAQEMAARDHSKYAAFVFCIMSHGDKKDVIYGVDNRKAAMEDLMYEFTATNCPALENKPKLFFIQACRGQRRDPRMNRLSASTSDNITGDIIQIKQSPDADLASGVSAREADFLLAFATVPGCKAWRSKQVGSWFIQELVDVIRMCHRRHHLLDMLTEVNKRVADIANEYPDIDLSFQVPAPTHTLRAQVFL